MADRGMHSTLTPTATNATHLLWVGRWVAVVKHGDSWTFRNGRDAVDWLRYGTEGGR